MMTIRFLRLTAALLFVLLTCFSQTVLAQRPEKEARKRDTTQTKAPLSFNDRFDFGAKFGFNLATFRGAEVSSRTVQIGVTAGLSATWNFHPRMALQLEANYTNKGAGARYDIVYYEDTVILGVADTFLTEVRNDARLAFHYIEVPLLFKPYIIKSKDFRAFFTFGPTVGFLIEAKIEGTTDVFISEQALLDQLIGPGTKLLVQSGPIEDKRLTFSRFDFGLMIGGGSGYDFKGKGRLTFDIRYNLGFPDIAENDVVLRPGAFYTMIGYEF